MQSENNHLKRILEDSEKQLGSLRFLKETRKYKLVSGVTYLKKNHRHNGVKDTVSEIQKTYRHVFKETNEEISKNDILTTACELAAEIQMEATNIGRELIQINNCTDNLSVLRAIKSFKRKGETVVCVMAPLESIDLPDGYSRRIKNIDELFSDMTLRVYISTDLALNTDYPICSQCNEYYYSIKYNPQKEVHCEWIDVVADLVGMVYIHSVYQSAKIIAEDTNVTKFYDFHGVVPEELMYLGNEEMSKSLEIEEKYIVENATYIMVANKAMEEHIMKKYPACPAEFILMPMNNEDNDRAEYSEEIVDLTDKKPIVIYSGGLQKWQLISEMQDAIERMADKAEFDICVSDPEEFEHEWGNRKRPTEWTVTTKTAEELMKDYKAAQYGFVLRDDIIVNQVACPTKIIDYIKYGIIPIMKTSKIGDFERKGMNYVPLSEFINGDLPSEDERIKMVKANKAILDSIMDDYKSGRERLKECFSSIQKRK